MYFYRPKLEPKLRYNNSNSIPYEQYFILTKYDVIKHRTTLSLSLTVSAAIRPELPLNPEGFCAGPTLSFRVPLRAASS